MRVVRVPQVRERHPFSLPRPGGPPSRPIPGVNAISAAAEFAAFVDPAAAGMMQQGLSGDACCVPDTTTAVNKTEGAIAVNTIPAGCTLHLKFRSIADNNAAERLVRVGSGARDPGSTMQAPGPGLFCSAGIPPVACGPGSISGQHLPGACTGCVYRTKTDRRRRGVHLEPRDETQPLNPATEPPRSIRQHPLHPPGETRGRAAWRFRVALSGDLPCQGCMY